MSSHRPTPPPEGTPLNTAELRLLADRERNAQAQRESRARRAKERAAATLAKNPSGYIVPPMPAGLRAQRQWLRAGHDAYSHRQITHTELTEMRRSVSVQAETYKAGAVVRGSFAQDRAAVAQEKMADALALVEHGGAAVALLARLREGLASGVRRPLPGMRSISPPPSEPAS